MVRDGFPLSGVEPSTNTPRCPKQLAKEQGESSASGLRINSSAYWAIAAFWGDGTPASESCEKLAHNVLTCTPFTVMAAPCRMPLEPRRIDSARFLMPGLGLEGNRKGSLRIAFERPKWLFLQEEGILTDGAKNVYKVSKLLQIECMRGGWVFPDIQCGYATLNEVRSLVSRRQIATEEQ